MWTPSWTAYYEQLSQWIKNKIINSAALIAANWIIMASIKPIPACASGSTPNSNPGTTRKTIMAGIIRMTASLTVL